MSIKNKILAFLIPAFLSFGASAQALSFNSEAEIVSGLGMLGGGDALLKKQLGTGVGKPIFIGKMYVWSFNGADWEKGGKLHLLNDDSMGRQYRVTCSVSPSAGDKFMADKMRRDIKIQGVIKSYSSASGLVIDPCNATW